MTQTKYVVIFQDDPLTMIGPNDNGVFHNLEDIKQQFRPIQSAEIVGDTVVITDLCGHKIVGQIYRVKSFL
jgi:hypothetical protein